MQVHGQAEERHRAATLGRAVARIPNGLRERIGTVIGTWWAPAISAISQFRRARMFHPRGLAFSGRSEPNIGGAFANLGAQLEGRVLARYSGALWKQPVETFDVLGIGLRIRPGDGPDLTEHPSIDDQDLLFATIRSPLTMMLSPFTTDAHDFVTNRYWAVSPFAVHDHERVELRLVPVDPPKLAGPRDERLREAVAAGRAVWRLEARKTLSLQWHAVARITLEHEVDIDQEALRFDPFRVGCGVVPVGLVHSIRRAAYPASQEGRP
ncbi:MAG: hypothetical protein M3680_01980 [Myxococcota bacterium]|nr:hypothetical protein [Myxococcota bacterium]